MVIEKESIQRILVDKSAGFLLHNRGESPVGLPSKYLTLKWEELEGRPEMLNGLVACYREVYGSDEPGTDGNRLWGEGGMCSVEKWDVTVPLDKFREMRVEGKAICPSCGSNLIECYPEKELIGRIKDELTSGEEPFLTLMLGDEKMPVAGFAWGAILSSSGEVRDRLVSARYSKDRERGEAAVSPLVEILGKEGVKRMVFFDEFAVHPNYRKEGFEPVRYLAREGFEIGVKAGVTQELFWTKTTSRIFPITYSFGFEPIGKVGDLTYMLNRDVRPTLKMLQNLSERDLSLHLYTILGARGGGNEG